MSVKNEIINCCFRVGYGYDVHRLEPLPPDGMGLPFRLGGIPIVQKYGPVGNTDADALLHAITDALLGALAIGNMGSLLKDNVARESIRDSSVFLLEACKKIREMDWEVGNLDATIVTERPRLANYLDEIRQKISDLLDISKGQVSVRVKSHEGLDDVGAGRGIEAHAIVMLYKRTILRNELVS